MAHRLLSERVLSTKGQGFTPATKIGVKSEVYDAKMVTTFLVSVMKSYFEVGTKKFLPGGISF